MKHTVLAEDQIVQIMGIWVADACLWQQWPWYDHSFPVDKVHPSNTKMLFTFRLVINNLDYRLQPNGIQAAAKAVKP